MHIDSDTMFGLAGGIFIAGIVAARCGNKPDGFFCRTRFLMILGIVIAILGIVMFRNEQRAIINKKKETTTTAAAATE